MSLLIVLYITGSIFSPCERMQCQGFECNFLRRKKGASRLLDRERIKRNGVKHIKVGGGYSRLWFSRAEARGQRSTQKPGPKYCVAVGRRATDIHAVEIKHCGQFYHRTTADTLVHATLESGYTLTPRQRSAALALARSVALSAEHLMKLATEPWAAESR
ncbi:hypothetical protein C8R43DRAFT_1042844 [Mycena crocata]|nr:hypothetical protein C8R43DRAFT_1042844 [Mycena crocata]